MMEQKRVEWVDIAKYVCIMFVMLSHLESRTEILKVFYTPFFLTVFFFAAGYVYNPTDNFKTFLVKKIKGLFVPWMVFGLFDMLLCQVFSFNEHDSFIEELKWNVLQLRGHGDKMWFVAALFVAFIPFYFLISWSGKDCNTEKKRDRKIAAAITISLLLSIVSVIYTKVMNPELLPWKDIVLPWHLEYIFQAMFFMVLGYFFKVKYENIFDRYNNMRSRVVCWIIYLVIIYAPFIANAELPLALNILHQYISQLISIAAIVSVCKAIKINRYISYVGRNTLVYFALHPKMYSLIQTMCKKFFGKIYSTILDNVVASSIFAVLLTFLLSFILIIPAYIINRWFPFVLGRKKVQRIDYGGVSKECH